MQVRIPRATSPRTTLAERSPALLLIPPVVTTTVLWMMSPHQVELGSVFFALLLIAMPWGSYVLWRASRHPGLPVFAFVSGAYWLYFALPMFMGNRTLALAGARYIPGEDVIAQTMALTCLSVGALWAGMQTPLALWVPADLPDIVDHPRSWSYVRGLLAIGVALKLYAGGQYLLGEGGRQIMVTLGSMVPSVAFILLLLRYYSGRSTRADRVTIVSAVCVLALGGLASGWLGAVASLVLTYGSVMLLRERTLPWAAIAGVLTLILFLQVGKNEFRNTYWNGEQEAGITERALFWISSSATKWASALDGSDGSDGGSQQTLISQTVDRLSLITQVAQVVEMTPRDVPYQMGSTYRYLAITWIPRFLWPNKPSISEANQYYQVAYGMTEAWNLNSVSIAVGFMAEGFMNFGWVGSVGVMFIVGILLGVYERLSGLTRSSSLFLSISLALIPGLIAVESQLGQYVGGVAQQMVLTAMIFLPVTRRKTRILVRRPIAPQRRVVV